MEAKLGLIDLVWNGMNATSITNLAMCLKLSGIPSSLVVPDLHVTLAEDQNAGFLAHGKRVEKKTKRSTHLSPLDAFKVALEILRGKAGKWFAACVAMNLSRIIT